LDATSNGTTAVANTNGHGLTRLVRERLGERSFYALATAVREHEIHAGEHPLGVRHHDEELYRSLRQICGEL
jgi:hypothetical protein